MSKQNAFIDRVRSECELLADVDTRSLRARSAELRREFPDNVGWFGRKLSQQNYFVKAFALMSEAIFRTTGKSYYDVQLLGGRALTEGRIAEMQTGEGKTLTTALPAFALGLSGRGVHVATTNQYLATRDCEELRPALELLGVTVGLLPPEHDTRAKMHAYRCDTVFGTGYDFGFDFLRDQVALRRAPDLRLGTRTRNILRGGRDHATSLLQREHGYAIIDEADSVLIDEATMPLVLSLPSREPPPVELMTVAANLADTLQDDIDYTLNPVDQSIQITDTGWQVAHEWLTHTDGRGLRRPWINYVEQALRAKWVLSRDVDYVLVDGQVQIVDQFTGRIHPERAWRDGLHQAVEVREGVEVTSEKEPEGKISRQRYFQFYQQLCGMTGTAAGNEAEFKAFYKLSVELIPTNRPCQRIHHPTNISPTHEDRNCCIARNVIEHREKGQPILLGTRTIRHSIQLSRILSDQNVPHTVLNGVQDEDEAHIISTAGKPRTVTIATNMAGRGTDIRLDQAALDSGGLCVLAAEHNSTRRVDRQLAGRAARQGQPGEVQFFAALEDELLEAASSGVARRLAKAAHNDVAAQEGQGGIDREILALQREAEAKHFERRRQMVQRDQWMETILETLAKTA